MLIRDYNEDVIFNEDVNTSLGKVENMLISAAKRCLKIRIRTNRKKLKLLSNKKWFDKECRFKKQELRKISNLKHRDRDRVKMNLAGHHVRRHSGNYFEPWICDILFTICNIRFSL